MMNMIELQEQLKDFSQGQLIQEMKMPSGNVPQYLVLSEMQRRKRMQATAAGDQGMPTTTVAEDAVSAAGVPQGGIAQMARTMAPQTDMTQNTGQGQVPTQRMQAGGIAGVSSSLRDFSPSGGDRSLAAIEALLAQMQSDETSGDPYAVPLTIEEDLYDPRALAADVAGVGDQPREGVVESVFGPVSGHGYTPGADSLELAELAGGTVGPRNIGTIDPNFPGYTEYELRRSHQGSGVAPRDTTPSPVEVPPPDEEPTQPDEAPLPTEAPTDAGGGTDVTSDTDRLAQQDRWLSLARFGLGLMSSDQPTFGGAIGEAGMDALDYMQGMEQQRFERDLAERTLAARTAGGAGGAGPEGPTFGLSTDTDRLLGSLQTELDRVDAQLAMMGVLPGQAEVEAGSPANVLLQQRSRILSDISSIRDIGSGGAMSALRAFEQQQQQGGGNSYDVAD